MTKEGADMDGRPLSLLSRSRAGRAVAWFGVAVIAMVWGAIVWDLDRERSHVLGMAEGDTANLARAFEEHFLRTVAGLDQTLLYLRAEYERSPENFNLNASVANAAILRRVSVQIARIGADGILADSNVTNFARVDLSDREHFRVHLRGGDALFVSKPVLGRASGRWSIQLTRRLETRDGEFDGVLVISLDPEYLSNFYASFDIGADAAVLVTGRDGVVRAGAAASPVLGRQLPEDLVAAVFSNGQGSWSAAGPLDDLKRIGSYRVVSGLPLAVLVARSQKDVLAPHLKTVRGYLLVGGGLTVLLGAVVALLFSLVRRQEMIASDLTVKKAELIESRNRLRRYVADLERIAEVSAHDLQEPLRRVVSYAQLLSKHAENVLDEEGRGYVAQVVEGAQRVRKLVQDLEAFVAVDHLPPVAELTPAETAMAVATRRLAKDIEASGATLVVDALPKVAADRHSLAEIFSQLVDNALRYRARDRKPIVHVTARREGDLVLVGVRDNGIGIEQRHWARVFEIFHRLRGVDDKPGTGMGLAIVRRMVERLGGRIWVESVPGEGATFWFTLPTVVGQAKDTELDQEANAA